MEQFYKHPNLTFREYEFRLKQTPTTVIWPIRSFNLVYNRIDDTFERSDWPNDGRGLIELELVFAKG